jgi:transposase
MMGRKTSQTSLFEVTALVEPKVEQESIYSLLHHLGSEYLSDEDFAAMYAPGRGRPSIPPSLLAKVCLLQRHDNVSDREAARRVKFDLRWLYALNLPLGYDGFAHANLCHFRARLQVCGLERIAFDRFNELAVKVGVLDPEAPQAIDSSHILGAAAVQDTYDLLHSSLRKLLGVLVEQEPQWAEQLIARLELADYQQPAKPDIDWSDADARAQWLQGVVTDSRALLAALDKTPAVTDEVREAASLLIKILKQDIEEPDDPDDPESGPRLKQGVAKDRTISTTDPELRHGRKSRAQCFDGYKLHITEDLETQLITNVNVTPGNSPDHKCTVSMVEEQQVLLGATPDELLGDSQCVTTDDRVALAKLGVQPVAKLPPASNGARFSKQDFELDLQHGTVTCPAGHTTTRTYAYRDRQGRRTRQFKFPAQLCQECSLKQRCTRSKYGRRITLHYHEEVLQAAREYNQTAEFQERYRHRAAVERKLGELLWRHGLRFGRYFGTQKTKLQALWTAAVVNLKRLGKLVPELFRPTAGVRSAA